MARIRQYELLEEFNGDETFVVETDNGTKALSVNAIKDHITEKIEEKAAQLNQSEVTVESDNESEYILSISIGAETITTPNLKGKSIASIQVVNHHLMIYFNDATSYDCGVIDGEVPKYGVCRDIPSHSPTLTRVGDATGLIAQVFKGNNDEEIRNDFDTIYPWSEIKRCTLSNNGAVNHYEDDPDYKEDGTDGQVMVEIPKFYIAHYFDESGAKEYWYISKEKINSRYRLPKPFIAADGTELDHIYIAAFLSTNDNENILDSKSTPTAKAADFAYSWAVEYAKTRGTNWHQLDIAEYSDVLVPLFIVEFATLDSQSVFYAADSEYVADYMYVSLEQVMADNPDTSLVTRGNEFFVYGENEYFVGQEISIFGIAAEDVTGDCDVKDETNGPYAIRNITNVQVVGKDEAKGVDLLKITFDGGAVDIHNKEQFMVNIGRNGVTNYIYYEVGYLSGSFAAPKDQGSDFVYRGIENLYGKYTWLAGVLKRRYEYFVTDKLAAYGTAITDDYAKLGYNATMIGFVRKLGLDEAYPWATLPTENGGASDTDFCDKTICAGADMVKSVRFGGGYDFSCGLFAFYCNTNATDTNVNNRCGARLSYRSYQ
jgi:hypothetical protein